MEIGASYRVTYKDQGGPESEVVVGFVSAFDTSSVVIIDADERGYWLQRQWITEIDPVLDNVQPV